MFPKDYQKLVLVKSHLIGESPKLGDAEGSNSIVRYVTEVFHMKLKDAARIACFIESEGSIRLGKSLSNIIEESRFYYTHLR